MNAMVEGFLVGVVATASLTCSLFFVRFFRRTRDVLFLAFALVFFVEAATRVATLSLARPNESSPWFYVIRAICYLMVVVVTVRKNYA